jgi:site-specific DNA-methyltransferase (adenine-specific)
MINLYNGDCLEAMVNFKDNQFDLAIVDPPYGIGTSKVSKKKHLIKQKNGVLSKTPNNNYKNKDWDNITPKKKYFDELKRISKNQIVWGVNYYVYCFNGGRIVWDKLNDNCDQFDCEIAYNSINNRTDLIRYKWIGMFQGKEINKNYYKANKQNGNKKLNEKRIHPTQKPVKLYEWLLMNYAKEGDKILDTHLGSGSIAIACHNLGYDLTGYELDKDYFEAATKRLKQHQSQIRMF